MIPGYGAELTSPFFVVLVFQGLTGQVFQVAPATNTKTTTATTSSSTVGTQQAITIAPAAMTTQTAVLQPNLTLPQVAQAQMGGQAGMQQVIFVNPAQLPANMQQQLLVQNQVRPSKLHMLPRILPPVLTSANHSAERYRSAEHFSSVERSDQFMIKHVLRVYFYITTVGYYLLLEPWKPCPVTIVTVCHLIPSFPPQHSDNTWPRIPR